MLFTDEMTDRSVANGWRFDGLSSEQLMNLTLAGNKVLSSIQVRSFNIMYL